MPKLDPNLNEDDSLLQLSDPAFIKQNQLEAESKYSSVSKEDWLKLRRRAKTDLFWLSYAILGYTRLTVTLHGHVAAWYQKWQERQFREVLLPRGHFKSTVITISDSIQTVLPDDEGDQPWPRNLGTNCRVCIAHETHDMASSFLFSITGHFTSNILLMGLFPECVPNPKKHRINKQQLELPRTKVWGEPTIDTLGVGAKGQGRHYNKLFLDDLIGDKARDSKTEMQTAKDWFDNIQSFFSYFPKDQFVILGTRWAYDDLYAHAHKMYENQLARYVRGVEEYSEEEGKKIPIFPEEFPPEKLQILRRNKKIFSAQYANDPSAGATEFDKTWIRYYYWTGPHTLTMFLQDEEGKPAGKRTYDTREMDIIILVDPAISGKPGISIVGTAFDGTHFILHADKSERNPPTFVDFLFQQVMKWQPRLVAVEEVIFSALYKPYLEAEMRLRGLHFYIQLVKTGQKAKIERVRGLSSYFAAGQIIFNEKQDELIEEYNSFGATDDYHILDSLAYGPELWRSGRFRNVQSELGTENFEDRDIETGYSTM